MDKRWHSHMHLLRQAKFVYDVERKYFISYKFTSLVLMDF